MVILFGGYNIAFTIALVVWKCTIHLLYRFPLLTILLNCKNKSILINNLSF